MGRGLFSGIIWGSLVAILSLWLLSQVGGMVGLLANPEGVSTTAPETELTGGDDTQIDTTPLEPIPSDTPSSDLPRESEELATAETEPAPTPQTIPGPAPEAVATLEEPRHPNAGGSPAVPVPGLSRDAGPVAPVAGQLLAPGEDTLPDIPLAPPPVEQVTAAETVTQPPKVAEVLENPAQNPPETDTVPAQSDEPDQPAAPVAEVAPGGDFTSPVVVPTPEISEPTPEPEPEQEVANLEKPAAPAVPNTSVLDGDGSLESAGPLEDRASNVRTHRLPTIGGGAADPTTPSQDAGGSDTAMVDTGLAIQQFSQPFTALDNRPLMAILLLPDGQGFEVGTTNLPFPVSYVVDASQKDAAQNMTAIRNQGFEVVALMPLPGGASPQDVETAFQTYLNRVPEAVAALDTDQAGFQSGRQVATQVAQILAATGQGMITYSKGLNSAPQIAEREGVPAALVFRVFDGAGQDGAAIKRFLDQAAFRAGQHSGVILVGHNRPETIRALTEWSLGNRASTVAMAPVSAVLLAQ